MAVARCQWEGKRMKKEKEEKRKRERELLLYVSGESYWIMKGM